MRGINEKNVHPISDSTGKFSDCTPSPRPAEGGEELDSQIVSHGLNLLKDLGRDAEKERPRRVGENMGRGARRQYLSTRLMDQFKYQTFY